MDLQIIRWQALPGCVEAVIAALNSMDVHTLLHTFTGCIASYTVQSRDNQMDILTVTLWQSPDNVQEYLDSTGFKHLTYQLRDLLAGLPESTSYKARIEY